MKHVVIYFASLDTVELTHSWLESIMLVSLAGNMKKFFKNSILKLNCVCQRIIHEWFFSPKIEVGLKEDLCVVSMSNAVENTLSLGTEVAGLPKINIDIVERCGY